jgi:hypothetical protein
VFIQELNRHLAVSSISELNKSLKLDKGFWNMVSIREPQVPRPDFPLYAKRYHEVICEDREEADQAVPSRPPRVEDVVGITKFVDAYPGRIVEKHSCGPGTYRARHGPKAMGHDENRTPRRMRR